MPLPPPPRALAWPRRRTLLASAAGAVPGAVLFTGCSDGGGSGGTGGVHSVSARARARAARDSRGLLERYDAVISAHPALAERLAPLRAEVAAHAEAFGGGTATPSRSPGTSAPASAPTASTAAPASAPASAPVVPADEKDARAALAAAERALADRRAKSLLEVDGELARLLASVAAAGAAHAYLLTEDGK